MGEVKGERVSGSSARSDPQRPKRPWTAARTTDNHDKGVGTWPMQSNLCTPLIALSNAVRSKVIIVTIIDSF